MKFLLEESELNISDCVVLYFYATWMPYNKKMLNMLETLEQKHPKIVFQAIDVDFFKSLCVRFRVTSVPTLIIIKKNTEAKRVVGLVLASALKKVFVDIYV